MGSMCVIYYGPAFQTRYCERLTDRARRHHVFYSRNIVGSGDPTEPFTEPYHRSYI